MSQMGEKSNADATTTATVPIEDITRTALSQLQREAPHMSNARIERCLEMLTKTVSDLRGIANARAPFCTLPVEILNQIMEAIPDLLTQSTRHVDFRPFWHSAAKDNTMLVPIMRTCRYLRTVALSNPFLWSTVVTRTRSAFPSDARLSDSAPLAVVVTPSKEFTNRLDAFYPQHAHRIQELHFTDIGHRYINYVQSLVKYSSPGLQSCNFYGRTGALLKWPTHSLPLSAASVGTLRDLYIDGVPLLPSLPLPSLTHLALCGIDMQGLHIAIANLLSHCPSLESLVLSSLSSKEDAPLPEPQPLCMKRLRRLTLSALQETALRYYLALLHQTPSQSATQLLLQSGITAPAVTRWLSQSSSQADRIAFALTQPPHLVAAHLHVVTFTTISSDRVGQTSSLEYVNLNSTPNVWDWYAELAKHSAAPVGVREVWVTNVTRMSDHKFAMLQSTIASLPALETLVLKDHRIAGHTTVISPDLSMCPSALDPSFQSHHLKTLRLIYGLSPQSSSRLTYVLYAVSFADMLVQLRTGAYSYFEHLVLQLARQLVVNEADLSQLREHFSTVHVEHVDDLPDFPLPEYCIERRAGPYGSRQWIGALW